MQLTKILSLITFCVMTLGLVQPVQAQALKALIIDGQNNHGAWPKGTAMIKDMLEQTGLFRVEVERTAFTWQGPHSDASRGEESLESLIPNYPVGINKKTVATEEPQPDPDFKPNFDQYDVVISNFGWRAAHWPLETKRALENYMGDGGGLVIVHAANNSFGDWDEYNKMIGVGGWGDRDENTGPFLYVDQAGNVVKDPSPGSAGSHGPRYEYMVTIRDKNHPITKGLPGEWLHTEDELYDRLRGPAENVTVLATAYSDPVKNSPPWNNEQPGTGHHEPMLMAIEYGKGRVFHMVMGHADYSMECVGFIVTLQRGTEWAAHGKVTQKVPSDFPGKDKTSSRPWKGPK